MNNKTNSNPALKINSPKLKRKRGSKKKHKNKENIENHLKLLQEAAEIAQRNKLPEEKDFLK